MTVRPKLLKPDLIPLLERNGFGQVFPQAHLFHRIITGKLRTQLHLPVHFGNMAIFLRMRVIHSKPRFKKHFTLNATVGSDSRIEALFHQLMENIHRDR